MTVETPPALRLRGLTKRYDNGFLALEDFDLEIPDGAFFGLLGPNGAGKTTLLGILSTLVTPSAGEVRWGGERLQRVLDEVGLEPEARLRPARTYSRGMLQRLALARALLAEPSLLLLDEPFTGLDRPGAELLDRLIADLAAEGRAVVVATHDLEQARRWDTVLCLNHRQVAFGRPDQVLDRPVLEATYGGEIVEIPGTGGRGILPPHHH